MPPYAFLARKELDAHDIQDKLRAMQALGVPYTKDMLEHADADLEAQGEEISSDGPDLDKRYGGRINRRDFDGQPDRLTEMDALVAYLQMMGLAVPK